jgi:transposase-like protein
VPKPYPREFRHDVVRVARDRDPGVTVEQIAKDFGVHPMTLFKWMRQADVDAGTRPGVSGSDSAELREARRGSSCWSRRTRSCAGPLPTCRRRIYREKALPAYWLSESLPVATAAPK